MAVISAEWLKFDNDLALLQKYRIFSSDVNFLEVIDEID